MAKRVPLIIVNGRLSPLPNGDVLIDENGEDVTGVAAVKVGENVTAGDFVCMYDDGGFCIKPASSDSAGIEAEGFALESGTIGEEVRVKYAGVNNVLSGLTPGSRYYLSTNGAVISTPPTGTGKVVQFIGKAVSATELVFTPNDGVILA